MIDALLTGKLAANPEARTDADTVAGLLAMAKDETVALAGEFTPKVWTDRDGNAKPSADLKAHALLTPYHVNRKRQAMASQETTA